MDRVPKVDYLLPLLTWYHLASQEAGKKERYCSSCEPGHWPALRLPDLRDAESESSLREEGYTRLDTSPYKTFLLLAKDTPEVLLSEGKVLGVKIDIYVPKKEHTRQHYVFRFRGEPKEISETNKQVLKLKLDELANAGTNKEAFPKAILVGDNAFFLMVIEKIG